MQIKNNSKALSGLAVPLLPKPGFKTQQTAKYYGLSKFINVGTH